MVGDILEPVIRYTFIGMCFILAALALDGGWQAVSAYFQTCH
jgi:hypothetical protein